MDEKQTSGEKTVRPTKKQKEMLGFIESFIDEHGYSPSYREIMDGPELHVGGNGGPAREQPYKTRPSAQARSFGAFAGDCADIGERFGLAAAPNR